MKIEVETDKDSEAITQIYDLAFGQPEEGKVICALRKELQYNQKLSLVAGQDSRAIGHLLLTPIIINGDKQETRALALAPMSVHPEKQCQFVVPDECYMDRKLKDEALSHAAVSV